MKKGLLLFALMMTIGALIAQDTTGIVQTSRKKKPKFVFGGDGIFLADSAWRVGGFAGFSISQTALYQWAPGGSNNFSFLLTAGVFANYKKGKSIWDNSFDCKWGMVANGLIRNKALAQSNLQKNIDILALKTMYGYQIKNTLYAAAKLNFESQFSPSYDYSLTDTSNGRFRRYTISKFAAPAVLTIGPGLTYKPKEYFTLFFSPVEGKMTFVTPDSPGRDTATAGDGTFRDAYYTNVDETRYGLKRGDFFMGELGWELDLLFQKDIVKNVNWKSHLNIFGAYLNASYNTVLPKYYSDEDSLGFITAKESNKYIPTVRWDNDIIFKVNSWLSASLSVRLVYQYNALTPVDKRKNETGAKGPDGITDKDKYGNTISAYNRLQIFEQFGIGLMAKF
ncbi:MAG TPA: DUF3078 domain-containing protein [Chitinophagales bacterium]|nr:DUF3078 domain-containing protein [Chitinophagales bacterium]